MIRTLISETVGKTGETVLLKGWVNTRRDHGKIVFIDLRDSSGVIQIVFNSELAEGVRPEDVVYVTGLVKNRPDKLANPKLFTGTIEVEAEEIKIISHSNELPLPLDSDGRELSEEIRLRYRYLDLRRLRMQKILRLRSQFIRSLRESLFNKNFVEIETPLLTKSTKEGARDFLVPSRFQPGKFYALPQSPQQYKQLLMVAGVEKYFQVAKCIRDEDLRADRGFEFTQLDVEMSFVTQKDVMDTVEQVVKTAVKAVGGRLKEEIFPVINYQEAVDKYGADKFDLRTDEDKKTNVLAFAWVINFPFFKKVNKQDAAETLDSKSGWTFTHNPFSRPIQEHLAWHLKRENIDQIITDQYDLVCNGYEVGGGSIRAHEPEILKATMGIMGYSEAEIQTSIGHMLEAFSYGTPPHGGIALGLDRLVMILAGESSLKEVIAFPMTSTGRTAVMDAPSVVPSEQLRELGLKVIQESSKLPTGENICQEIISKLDKLGIKYQTFEHEPVYTSEQAAKIRNTPIEQGAKALVMFADKKPLLTVISAPLKVNSKKLKAILKIKDLRMATPEEVKSLTGLEIGCIPPFGSVLKLPTYVEKSLSQQKQIVFNAGLHTRSISLSYSDFVEIERPQIEDFT